MTPLPKPRKTPLQGRSRLMVETILEATARVLAERGYAGTNTNLVAERAGVSVGSIYQYFPNKNALITALHERHAAELHAVIDQALSIHAGAGLGQQVRALVQAVIAAHQVAPDLHRMLERELPLFDAPKDQSPADGAIYRRVRAFLEDHKAVIAPDDLDLATWTVLHILETLSHAAVIDPPPGLPAAALTAAAENAVLGFLTYTSSQ